jgi:F0F1-type ATP synthase assembly protein I
MNIERSPLARGVEWSTRITSVSLLFVVPGLIGLWVDSRLGTGILFTAVGMILGFVLGFWEIIKVASRAADGETTGHPAGNSRRRNGETSGQDAAPSSLMKPDQADSD